MARGKPRSYLYLALHPLIGILDEKIYMLRDTNHGVAGTFTLVLVIRG